MRVLLRNAYRHALKLLRFLVSVLAVAATLALYLLGASGQQHHGRALAAAA